MNCYAVRNIGNPKKHQRRVHDVRKVRIVPHLTDTTVNITFYKLCNIVFFAGLSGRAVKRVGLQPLVCWDCGFEFRLGCECASLVFVVCCISSGFYDVLVTRWEQSYRICLCLTVCAL